MMANNNVSRNDNRMQLPEPIAWFARHIAKCLLKSRVYIGVFIFVFVLFFWRFCWQAGDSPRARRSSRPFRAAA